ncbi:MAG: toll/interleukin-1 receptor domain-containing protein [Anaerolineae bacterium]|nr:toll/interleukin-1 receptor domain-containing protein [Chloroflexota bacterium]MBN8634627.1 toll/interleukin-1 receptor domain-containing protein [Anaerolineae bacterium]
MPALPVAKRQAHAFLSYSHKNKAIADKLHYWLDRVAGLKIWYDSVAIDGGDSFQRKIEQGIASSRCIIRLISEESLKSTWVKREYERAFNHQVSYPQFRIIAVRVDDCVIEDGFMADALFIDMPNGELTTEFCRQLLSAIYPTDLSLNFGSTTDIYVSYGWNDSEQPVVRYLTRFFDQAGFRLIGDAKDQPKFKGRDQYDRIREIMESCRGFLAIAPYRADEQSLQHGGTSKYILREIELAMGAGLPVVIIKDPRVTLNVAPTDEGAQIVEFSMEAGFEKADTSAIEALANTLRDRALPEPKQEHYVFYATDINRETENRRALIREVIQRVTSMPCRFGESIGERNDIYRVIIDNIKHAFVMVADLSDMRPNILIESGIAIGADVHIFYVQGGEVHRPPVMLGSPQIHEYRDDGELIGIVHQIMLPYRRAVLNSDLS